MAKVNLKNINNKNKKNNNKKEQEQNIKEKERKQKQWEENIVLKSLEIINKLNDEINKTFRFNKSKKETAKSKINEINILIENKEFKELENIIKAFEKIEEENKKDLEKSNYEKEPICNRIKKLFHNMRIPYYTRIKKIINNDAGKTRIVKLLAIFGITILAIIAFVISVLMIINIIPLGISNEVANILPAILIALSIGVLYFI